MRQSLVALALAFAFPLAIAACSSDDSGNSGYTGGGTSTGGGGSSSSCQSSSNSSANYGCVNGKCACSGSMDYTLTEDEAKKKCVSSGSSGNCPQGQAGTTGQAGSSTSGQGGSSTSGQGGSSTGQAGTTSSGQGGSGQPQCKPQGAACVVDFDCCSQSCSSDSEICN